MYAGAAAADTPVFINNYSILSGTATNPHPRNMYIPASEKFYLFEHPIKVI